MDIFQMAGDLADLLQQFQEQDADLRFAFAVADAGEMLLFRLIEHDLEPFLKTDRFDPGFGGRIFSTLTVAFASAASAS